MNRLVLDLETTVQRFDNKTDNSPFHPDNRCVSAHFGWLEWDTVEEVENLVFYHNEKVQGDDPAPLIDALNKADVLICHNSKFDVLWLMELGFPIPPEGHCTMVREYVLSKGQRREISLKAVAERRNTTRKKSDLVGDMFKSGVGFEAMPLSTVIEYAEADVKAAGEIYLKQMDDFADPANQSLENILELSNEMMLTLLEMERNGINVDMEALSEVEQQFTEEKLQLQKRLNEIVEEVMGDTPINLNSGADMTKVVYSRTVIDRAVHRTLFNIGIGPNGKPLRPPRMSKAGFASAVRRSTEVVKKTQAICCEVCNGKGKILKYKNNGEPYKKETKCKDCEGKGALYMPLKATAGLKLSPTGPEFASINGFKTDKTTIKLLTSQAEVKGNDLGVEFLTKISRLNAVSVYLDSFVKGIQTWTRKTGLLHTNFNQTVTATGRLSSSNPNFQNVPKKNFPIRKCVTSRFQDGLITEADFSSLELRVAGALSNDAQIIADVNDGKDVHSQTASIINQIPQDQVSKDVRQAAKAFTFAPLYGGMGAGEPEHVQNYFKQFFVIYSDLKNYQRQLMDGVMKNGIVQSPSGRQYFWPNPKRYGNGRISNSTQVVNYPVQGFGNDLVQMACVRAHRRFKELDLKSLLILTVHDSIVCDTHPDEKDIVNNALAWAMTGVLDEAKERWNYGMPLPLEIEIETGTTWLM